MKEESGFTLVEVMVVVSLTVLLLAWGVPSYSTWNKKHNIENWMVQLYSDLQFARMNAYGNKVVSGVYWGTGSSITSYWIRNDVDGDGTIDLDSGASAQIGAKVTTLAYAPVTVTFTPPVAQNSVSFTGRGFLNTTNALEQANQITFSISSTSGSRINCVEVTSTRVTLGQMSGGSCSPN